MKKKIFVILICLNISTHLSAGDFYIGLKDWQTSWHPGAADVSQRAASARSLAVTGLAPVFGIATLNYFEADSISDGKINMPGLTLSYVGRLWNMTYSGSYGKTNIDYDLYQVNTNKNYYAWGLSKNSMKMERQDHELLFSKLLGKKGFLIFTGLKYQSYIYDLPVNSGNAFGFAGDNVNGDVWNSPILFGVGMRSKFAGVGGVLGLGYTYVITDSQSVTLSSGGLILNGNMLNETQAFYYIQSQFTTQANYTDIRSLKVGLDEKMNLIGSTTDLTFNVKLPEGIILRFSGRYQEAKYSSVKSSVTFGHVRAINGIVYPFYAEAEDNYGVIPGYNGAKDIFKGVSIAVLKKI